MQQLSYCVLLVLLAPKGIGALDFTVVSWSSVTRDEMDWYAFDCPGANPSWYLSHSLDDSLKIHVADYDAAQGNCVCKGQPYEEAGRCIPRLDYYNNGAKMQFHNIYFYDAGILSCRFVLNGKQQAVLWNVTVVSREPTFTFGYEINGFSYNPNGSSRQVSVGTEIIFKCSTAFAGFNDPGVQLVLSYSDGGAKILQTSTPTAGITYLSSETSRVTYKYTVDASSLKFNIVCRVQDLFLPTATFQSFEQSVSSPTASLAISPTTSPTASPATSATDGQAYSSTSGYPSQGDIIGIAVGVAISVLAIIVVIIIIVVVIRRKKNNKNHHIPRNAILQPYNTYIDPTPTPRLPPYSIQPDGFLQEASTGTTNPEFSGQHTRQFQPLGGRMDIAMDMQRQPLPRTDNDKYYEIVSDYASNYLGNKSP